MPATTPPVTLLGGGGNSVCTPFINRDGMEAELGLPFDNVLSREEGEPVAEDVKCAGLRAMAGGDFFDDVVDATLLGRLDAGDGGKGTMVALLMTLMLVLDLVGELIPSKELIPPNGGGNLRGVVTGFRICDAPKDDEVVNWKDSDLEGLGTVTQSGSSVMENGLDGRFGLGIAPFSEGWIDDLAGRPLSSHHFLRSEDAGGRPGSMES